MKRFALLGDPVSHSQSPGMHAAAYRDLHLDCSYEAIRATPGDLPALVRSLREGEYDGFNVTVPHKTRVLELVDEVDALASTVGAANTLVRAKDGRIVASNTDCPALASELRALAPERTPEDWRASTAIVLGSGGAARSAIAALRAVLGVSKIVLRSRSGLAVPPSWHDGVVEPLSPSAHDREAITIVQATSAGMSGADPGKGVAESIAWGDLRPSAIALDVVYVPLETPFLRAARTARAAGAHGIRAANGLGMLATQGALAFELWLGVPAPIDAMRIALGLPARSAP